MSDLAKEAVAFERAVEKECSVLLRKDADEWESKNRAIVQLTRMVKKYEAMDMDKIQEIFGMNIFRIMKEPLKFMMSDLRSQQVRDTCTFLSTLAIVLGDHMRHFLRDLFPYVLDGVKQTNKVMGGYVDECIVTMIRNSTFKTCIPIIIEQMQHSKSKLYRERCIDYINEIIVSWDITDKDAEMLNEAIRYGVEDASVRCREISRLAYLNMFQMYPQKTEAMKMTLSKNVQKRLNSEEEKFLASEEYQLGQRQVDESGTRALHNEPDDLKKHGNLDDVDTTLAASTVAATTCLPPPASSRAETGGAPTDSQLLSSVSQANSSSVDRSPVSLRARRQSIEEGSVTSIQAVVRGALIRRMSTLKISGASGAGVAETCPSSAAKTPLKSTRGLLPPPGSTAKSPSNPLTGGDSVFDRLSAAKTKPSARASPESRVKTPLNTANNGGMYTSTGKFSTKLTTLSKKKKEEREVAAPLIPASLSDSQKKQAAELLKLKIAYAMKITDQNLALLRRLEGEDENSHGNSQGSGEEASSIPGEEAVADMMRLSADEVDMCRHFEDRINTLLLASEPQFASV